MANQTKKKVFNSDTKVRIISNTNSIIDWTLTNGRKIVLLKIGSPASIDFMELENMVWSSTLIHEGEIYVVDKDAFEATGIQNVKWEDIKPHTQLKKMLAELEAETLKEEIAKLPEGNKELLAEIAIQNFDNLKGSVVNTIEDGTSVKISQIKDDEKANKENQKNSSKNK